MAKIILKSRNGPDSFERETPVRSVAEVVLNYFIKEYGLEPLFRSDYVEFDFSDMSFFCESSQYGNCIFDVRTGRVYPTS